MPQTAAPVSPAEADRSDALDRASASNPNLAGPGPAHSDVARSTAVPQPSTESVSLLKTRIVPVEPLRGSRESLIRQNELTEADGLERIEDDADLHDRIVRGFLVPVPTSASLAINPNLPQERRYCRPWTAAFLSDLARAHQAQFRGPLQVSSAVRTIAYQKRLIEVNGNAAAAEGDVVSPHVTGATIDIAKSGLSLREIYWMRARLSALQDAGKIDVEEEFQQSCFHITVYKSYAPESPHGHRHAASHPQSAAKSGTAPATQPAQPAVRPALAPTPPAAAPGTEPAATGVAASGGL